MANQGIDEENLKAFEEQVIDQVKSAHYSSSGKLREEISNIIEEYVG